MRLKLFRALIFTLLLLPSVAFTLDIKDADLAGTWYPADADTLSKQIKDYLNPANPAAIDADLIAIISPHAGIEYSGPVAAFGFKLAENKKIDTVVVVGFSHRKDYDGIALFDKDGIRTPLGILYTDKDLTKKLISGNKKIFADAGAFKEENSLELILPFIQAGLGSPRVVLIAIGRQSWENCEILGESLYQTLKEQKNFLIVASSDMSHYLSDAQAKEIDTGTAGLIKEMEPQKLFLYCDGNNRLCGLASVVSTMLAAKKLGANKAHVLRQADSGDMTGEKGRVVGYISAALVKENIKSKTEKDNMEIFLTEQQKNKLLKIARDTIAYHLSAGKILEVKEDDPMLNQPLGAFVTLHKKGQLKGCIGNMIGRAPLYLTVRDMAVAAASEDPRFSPVRKNELEDIAIEISVLSPLKKIDNPDEIIVRKHGVLVKNSFTSGVYLPQVATETSWTKEQFMDSLCGNKAGMSPDAWKTGKCEIYIFTAEVFAEKS